MDIIRQVSDHHLDTAERLIRRGDLDGAAGSLQMAAVALSLQCRFLADARLEAALRTVAGLAGRRAPQGDGAPPGPDGGPAVWLHVLNLALPYGGLTAMATRWIANADGGGGDGGARARHSAVLLSQDGAPVPSDLRAAVERTGGSVHVLPPRAPILERAMELRSLARRTASHVVLHTHGNDVTAALAFGVGGGPPVLLVNHAAHVFWAGGSVADLVVNCRGSALEERWTVHHRGFPRCATVPIPLLGHGDGARANAPPDRVRRRKRDLSIPEDAFVILTSGRNMKYAKTATLDFVEVAERVLRRARDAVLLALGATADDRWRDAARRTGGRLVPLGIRNDVEAFHEIADLYVEGFPFGSTTALLEAGLAGVPVVLAPAECLPPFGSDGVAIDDVLERPASVQGYEDAILSLRGSAAARAALARRFREAVARHHTGAGWTAYLERAVASLAAEHTVQERVAPVPTDGRSHRYWSEFTRAQGEGPERCLDLSFRAGFRDGFRPKMTRRLMDICVAAREERAGRAVPTAALVALCNLVLPLVPRGPAARAYEKVYLACRAGSRTARALQAVVPRWLW